MTSLVKRHDPDCTLSLCDQDRREMMREIVVFEIELTKVEAKIKLSQNRDENDSERVTAELLCSEQQTDRETGELMRIIDRK